MDDITVNYDVDPELLLNFLDESEESMATIDNLFIELEQRPKDKAAIGCVFRIAHSIKGLAAFLNFDDIKNLTHELETVLAFIRDDKLFVTKNIIDVLLAGFDELSNMLSRVRDSKSQIQDTQRFNSLRNHIKEILSPSRKDNADISVAFDNISNDVKCISKQIDDSSLLVEDSANQKAQREDKHIQSSVSAVSRTMRVSEEKVDAFMSYVGELIEVSESFNLLQKKIDIGLDRQLAGEFKDVNSAFERLSNQLQKSLLSIRKQPAKNLLQKVPRMVRDLSNLLGKKIDVEISGEDILLDKSMIEALESPINHLVRNCVDHGIEDMDCRLKSGKSETGTIKICVSEQDEDVIIKIQDDGAGIDPEVIAKKAVQNGIINESNIPLLSKTEILHFIFSSGFSTAEKVSDVSGRGVGMDVVKTNIESLKGFLDLQSEPKIGTTVTLKLPSSLAVLVVNGMLVCIGSQQFIIKLDDIYKITRPEFDDITTLPWDSQCLNFDNDIYPIVRLNDLFGICTNIKKPADGIAILVKNGNCKLALLVDSILGQQRVVVKDLAQQFKHIAFFSGTAVLANRKVSLVFDIDGLIAEFSRGVPVSV